MAQYATAASKPTIGTQGRAALDRWLEETVASRVTPALFVGVASKDEVLYWRCMGEKVLGEPEKGEVNDDTSESGRRCLPAAWLVMSWL